MLVAFPTKKGTGISIYGDRADLRSLHETIHKLAEKHGEHPSQPQTDLLMGFAYEVRKAYEDQRSHEELIVSGAEVAYVGFNYLWTDLLILLCVARTCAGRTATSGIDQVNLLLLETRTKEALFLFGS